MEDNIALACRTVSKQLRSTSRSLRVDSCLPLPVACAPARLQPIKRNGCAGVRKFEGVTLLF